MSIFKKIASDLFRLLCRLKLLLCSLVWFLSSADLVTCVFLWCHLQSGFFLFSYWPRSSGGLLMSLLNKHEHIFAEFGTMRFSRLFTEEPQNFWTCQESPPVLMKSICSVLEDHHHVGCLLGCLLWSQTFILHNFIVNLAESTFILKMGHKSFGWSFFCEQTSSVACSCLLHWITLNLTGLRSPFQPTVRVRARPRSFLLATETCWSFSFWNWRKAWEPIGALAPPPRPRPVSSPPPLQPARSTLVPESVRLFLHTV